MRDKSEGPIKSDIGRCPKCGVVGRNHQPPEPNPDDHTLIVPFECLNCGHEWIERVPETNA